ncbi:MAG: leucine-rich repeat protein, partial [Lachnospiraceae bacterium]|nr:leucine-rich repeat protein [Lachnospiraceae bacterium]
MKIISGFTFNNFKYFVSEIADRSPQYEILSKDQVISLINIGSIKMNGLTANNGKLMIYGEEVKDMVPNLKNGKKTTTERYALAVDVTDGNPIVIYCDFVGRVKTESLAEAYDNQNKYTNIVFTKFIEGDYPSVQINKSIYVPTIKNSEGTRLFMPTTFGLKSVDNEIIESLKHETLSLENWLRTVYRCGYDVSVSYSKSTMSVSALDSRITEITFPKELSSLKLNENLDKIVVSNGTYMSMTGKAKKELQIVYRSDSVESFDVTGLLNVDTDNVIKGIPKTIRLYNLLNFLTDGNSNIKVLDGYNVDLSDKEINVFCQSLRSVEINSLILPNSIEISSCCYKTKVNNTIKIPSTVKDISYSFDNMSIENVTDGMYIDFSNATSLERIEKSFNNISNEVIDLSNCTKLTSISDSFKGCKNLKRVILPDNLENIYGGTFSLSDNIEYVNIPKNIKLFNFTMNKPQMYSKIEIENIERFTPHITNEVVVKNVEVLTGSLYRGLAYSGIEDVSYENIGKIEPWAFSRYSMDKFKFVDIHTLSTGCFSESTGEIIDLYNTSIKVINEHVFSKS